MMFESSSQFFESALFQTFGSSQSVRSIRFVGGGCINNTVRLETDKGAFFLKWNESEESDMFQKEAKGLTMLKDANCLGVASPIGWGRTDMKNYLFLEYIQKHPPRPDFWELFGNKLAVQHRQTADSYGLDHDNYIGRLPQQNAQKTSWITFFIENRLEVQLGLAIYNKFIDTNFARKFRMIYAQLPGLLPDEPASLLHGDLWSGNFISGPGGIPFIFDPAVYYGSREIELAFTGLFGGFDLQFYHSYAESYPLEPGFENRIELYNLYPLLVHVNLFGTSYLSGIESTLHRFI